MGNPFYMPSSAGPTMDMSSPFDRFRWGLMTPSQQTGVQMHDAQKGEAEERALSASLMERAASLDPENKLSRAQLTQRLLTDQVGMDAFAKLPTDKIAPVFEKVLTGLKPDLQTFSTPKDQTTFGYEQGSQSPFPLAYGPSTTEVVNPHGEVVQQRTDPGGLIPRVGETPFGGLPGAPAPTAPAEPAGGPSPVPGTTTSPTIAPAAQPAPTPSAAVVDPGTEELSFVPSQYVPLYQGAAAKYPGGVSAKILARQGAQESAFRPDVISGETKSSAGAAGISQFMPATAAEYAVDVTDPASSIDGQARMMQDMKAQFGTDRLALIAYNWGSGNTRNWLRAGGDPSKLPRETVEYVANILGDKPMGLAADNTRNQIERTFQDVGPIVRPEDVGRKMKQWHATMFLGTGAVPWLKDRLSRVGRQVDPNLSIDGSLEVVEQGARMKQLNLAVSQMRSGNIGGVKAESEALKGILPDFSVGTDPQTSLVQALELERLARQTIVERLETVNDPSTDKTNKKEAEAEMLRWKTVLRALPPKDQMELLLKDIQENPQDVTGLSTPGGLATSLIDMLTKTTTGGTVPEGVRSTMRGAVDDAAGAVDRTLTGVPPKLQGNPSPEAINAATDAELLQWRRGTNRETRGGISPENLGLIVNRLKGINAKQAGG